MSFSTVVRNAGQLMVKIQRTFLFYLLLVLTAGMLLEIGVRYFFNQSIFGLSDFIGYSSVWLYAVGASFATYEKSHIKAEFINALVRSDRTRHIFRLIAALISAFMSAVFTKWSYELCVYSVQVGEKTQAYPVPKVVFQSSFFVGGILMTIYFLWEALDCCIGIKENRPFIPAEGSH
ncbi:MAG: TRAP transporter small permease [Desulfohalobiaceae bacterium]|nr:TRAP transporter small permease [Desulfohalobiaceae bacterium]